MMELSKRLQTVADMVTIGLRIADVGTDHGYIPIYLVQQGRVPHAIAMDINVGPLERAREHIADNNLEEYIELRLSDGLQRIKNEEIDCMIAAGMGGGLVIRILSAEEEKVRQLKELVLQPQTEITKVRHYLLEKGYQIVDEDLVFEEGKYYPILKVSVSGADPAYPSYSDAEMEFGRILLEQRHPVLHQYLERELRVAGQIQKSLENQRSRRGAERGREVCERISMLEDILKKW